MAKRQHVYNSGRIHRAGASQQVAATATPPVRAKKKRRRSRRWPKVVITLVVVLAVAVSAVWIYADNFLLETGVPGIINPEHYTPQEFKKDVVNILVVGIDYEEGRAYGEGMGLTDMILYANYDVKNNKLNMLQIPRDAYVGENVPSGGSGKINAVYMSGENKTDPINNLVSVISDQYKLPVDYYVSMDMDGFKSIVNALNGVDVFIPKVMSYAGSYLDQGWHRLDGDAAEFFVRNRKGAGFERSDIDRLDNQRHFYSALFRRFLSLSFGDVKNLIPVFDQYCNTNMKTMDVIDLAAKAHKLQAEDVLFCRVPGVTGMDPGGAGRSLFVVDLYGRGTPEEPGVANLLNDYFRGYGTPVPVEEMGVPAVQIPASYTLYPVNVQQMGEVQAVEGENVTE